MNKNILLLDCGGTQDLIISKRLKNLGYVVHGFFHSKFSYGYYYKYYDYTCIITEHEYKDKVEKIYSYVEEHKIISVIPMSDASAELLSIYKDKLSRITHIDIPSHDVFISGYDKNSLMRICKEIGAPHPYTVDLEETNGELPHGMLFPAIIKPNFTNGARGMKIVNNIDEYKEFYPDIKREYGSCHIQQYIKMGGKQIEAQLYMGSSGELLHYSLLSKSRFYPVTAGSSCCNTSIDDISIINHCHQVLTRLNWVGFADFDLIEDVENGVVKIMELNPRVPACIKSAIVSGIDWAEILVDRSLSNPSKKYDYVPGKTLRHLGFEMLWFKDSADRFKSKPNWFKFIGKDLYYQDLDMSSIRSFFIGTLGNIIKILSPNFRKQKGGLR